MLIVSSRRDSLDHLSFSVRRHLSPPPWITDVLMSSTLPAPSTPRRRLTRACTTTEAGAHSSGAARKQRWYGVVFLSRNLYDEWAPYPPLRTADNAALILTWEDGAARWQGEWTANAWCLLTLASGCAQPLFFGQVCMNGHDEGEKRGWS